MQPNQQVGSSENRYEWLSEDWTATIVGFLVLTIALLACHWTRPRQIDWQAVQSQADVIREQESQLTAQAEAGLADSERTNLVKLRRKSTLEKLGIAWNAPGQTWLSKLEAWGQNPIDAFRKKSSASTTPAASIQWSSLVLSCLVLATIGAVATFLRRKQVAEYLFAFPALFLLATFAYLLAAQEVIKYYNFEYPLWGLFVGMLISNSIGSPKWIRPAVHGELYIKIGLVLMGAEVLLSRLMALGLPGIFVAWLVTPVVLVTTYIFGQRVLKIPSRSLNMVISADMSVCGVSAAIATAAACKAKKEELSLAIGLSLTFTAVMMVVMPQVVRWMGLDPLVGGAWMGGTIDSTGAVVAAGEALGVVGSETAITVKMIQNILIGVTAFGIAIYWTRWVEPAELQQREPSSVSSRVTIGEIWKRFPKFVVGFLMASLVCSIVSWHSFFGESWIQTATSKLTVPIRGWLFCLAFVSIGLSTNFRELAPYLRTGKPLVLYVCGQSFNLILTLAMAYLMFGVVFASLGE